MGAIMKELTMWVGSWKLNGETENNKHLPWIIKMRMNALIGEVYISGSASSNTAKLRRRFRSIKMKFLSPMLAAMSSRKFQISFSFFCDRKNFTIFITVLRYLISTFRMRKSQHSAAIDMIDNWVESEAKSWNLQKKIFIKIPSFVVVFFGGGRREAIKVDFASTHPEKAERISTSYKRGAVFCERNIVEFLINSIFFRCWL